MHERSVLEPSVRHFPARMEFSPPTGVLPVVLGLVLESGLAWAGLRFFKMGVAGLKEVSPLAFVAAGALLALATVAAMGVPAVRASRTDAMEALRAEQSSRDSAARPVMAV